MKDSVYEEIEQILRLFHKNNVKNFRRFYFKIYEKNIIYFKLTLGNEIWHEINDVTGLKNNKLCYIQNSDY